MHASSQLNDLIAQLNKIGVPVVHAAAILHLKGGESVSHVGGAKLAPQQVGALGIRALTELLSDLKSSPEMHEQLVELKALATNVYKQIVANEAKKVGVLH